MKANRLVLLAVAGVAAVVLSGCAHSGDAAATVDGTEISNSDVKFLAGLQCDAIAKAIKNPSSSQQQQPPQAVSLKRVRDSVVNALVQSQLNAEIADKASASYDKTSFSSAMTSFDTDLQAAPAASRARFREMVAGFYKNQLRVYTVAAQQLAAQGGSAKPTLEEVDALAQQLVGDFRKKADIEVDPVYGADSTGVAGSTQSSLSRPFSAFAKAESGAQEDPAFVAKLPANQRCG